MALDPRMILLAGQGQSPLTNLVQGFQAGQNIRSNMLSQQAAQQKMQQAAALQPLKQQALEQELLAQQDEQARLTREDATKQRLAEINQQSQLAAVIKPFVESGNLEGAKTELAGMASLFSPEAISGLMEDLDDGDIEGLKAGIGAIERMSAAVNIPTTLEQRKLDIRERELAQRKELYLGEAEMAGKKEREKAKGKAIGEAEAVDLIAETKAKIASDVEIATAEAKSRGETLTTLGQAKASLPALTEIVGQLRDLAPIATSTIGGKVFDIAAKELGFGATKGATAKAKYTAIIDNQILPLLKQTFGAAFTAAEGERLRATLGDPDADPSEKAAQLDAFISAKIREIETKERQLAPDAPTKSLSIDDLVNKYGD